MILNKSCVERGFAHASVYKTETINLNQDKANNRCGLRRSTREGRSGAACPARPPSG